MSNRKTILLYFVSVVLSALIFPLSVYFIRYSGGPTESVPFWFFIFEILSLGGFTIPIIIYAIFPFHVLHFINNYRKYIWHLLILSVGIIMYAVIAVLFFNFLNISPAFLPL